MRNIYVCSLLNELAENKIASQNLFNTQFTDYHLSTETIESTDGETRQNG